MSEIQTQITQRFPNVVSVTSHNQPVCYVPRSDWHAVAEILLESGFAMCLDVCAVDQLMAGDRVQPPNVQLERFEVVANFLSFTRHERIRLIAEVPAEEPVIDSIADVYPSANFAERETYDLFGISFEGHADLTRILMPDDWVGFPLRKDAAPGRIPVAFKEDPSPQ